MPEQLENSLRIKITGRCNRSCFFCHQEGGMGGIEDISFSSELKKYIDFMSDEFNITSVALTGGEPLIREDLPAFVEKIYKNTAVHHFSLTTNGTIVKADSFWEKLHHFGLRKVNISIPDILDRIKPNANTHSDLPVFQYQLRTLELLKSLGMSANVNIVVYNDTKYLLNVLNSFFRTKDGNHDINIALLPNLTNSTTYQQSEEVILEILEYYKCKQISSSYRKGTSNSVSEYRTSDGYHIQVKTTKPDGLPKFLYSTCNLCPRQKQCQEGFYGVRLEQRMNQLLLRMCIYRQDTDVLMPLDNFINSPIHLELKSMWGTNK